MAQRPARDFGARPTGQQVQAHEWPEWLGLGCEVECCDDGGGTFHGSWSAGEVIEQMAGHRGAKTGADGPRVQIRSRQRCERSPYAPGGLLVLQQCVPLRCVRPRPPPPPNDFLSSTPSGSILQLRHLGAWWDVALECRVDHSAGDGEVRVPRYRVRSTEFDDVGGEVDACALRPAWLWRGTDWTLATPGGSGPSGGDAGGDAGAGAGAPSGAASLKGRGASEVVHSRVRVWHHAQLWRARPAVGVVLGYVPDHGLSVQARAASRPAPRDAPHLATTFLIWQFSDGLFWVDDSDAWEWVAPDEELREPEFKEELVAVAEVEEETPVASAPALKAEQSADKGAPSSKGAGNSKGAGHSKSAARVPLHEGLRVELCGREEGFIGSWYEAEVLQLEGDMVNNPARTRLITAHTSAE